MIPFVDLKTQYQALKPQIHERLERVFEHGQYIMGPEVGEFEEKLAARTGAAYCITVASGTEALRIALMALDIGPGDEVITTAFSFVAVAEAIVLLGAKPVFVDIEPETCNIDASKIADRVSSKTRAIVPVSLYGQPVDMDEINAIAARHGAIPVIEDAAQSFGATYRGRDSANLSTIGCTSFFPSKPLGCYGDGGAIFTSDSSIAKSCREIRMHGQSGRYVHTRIGVGGRMDTLQCAIALAKLERFGWEIEQRQRIAARYHERLSSLEHGSRTGALSLLTTKPGRTSVFSQYTVLVNDRDAVRARLKDAGVPSAVHYPTPLNRQPAYARLCCPNCTPVSATIGDRVLSVPMSADLKSSEQDLVCRALEMAVTR